MWRYYLVAAEVTFAEGLLTIHQLQLARSQNAVPKARDYLYPAPQAIDYMYPAAQSAAVSSAAR